MCENFNCFFKKADSITYHAYIVYFSLSGGQARQVTSSDPASVSSICSTTACTTSHAQRRRGGGLCFHPMSHWAWKFHLKLDKNIVFLKLTLYICFRCAYVKFSWLQKIDKIISVHIFIIVHLREKCVEDLIWFWASSFNAWHISDREKFIKETSGTPWCSFSTQSEPQEHCPSTFHVWGQRQISNGSEKGSHWSLSWRGKQG